MACSIRAPPSLRAQRVVADETAARVAALARGDTVGSRPSRQRQALLRTRSPGRPAGGGSRAADRRRLHQTRCPRPFSWGTAPSGSAGRGEFARRAGSSTSSAVHGPADPDRVLRRRDDSCARSIRRISGRRQDRTRVRPPPHGVHAPKAAWPRRDRLVRAASRLSSASSTTWPGSRARATIRCDGGDDPGESRALAVGDAAEVWAVHLARLRPRPIEAGRSSSSTNRAISRSRAFCGARPTNAGRAGRTPGAAQDWPRVPPAARTGRADCWRRARSS